MNEVSIFDNLNTFINQAVYVLKNIGHCITKIPDLIGDGLAYISDFTAYCPPFVVFIVMFMFGTGIMAKGAHWGD